FRLLDHLDGLCDSIGIRPRAHDLRDGEERMVDLLASDVFRQLEVNGAGALFTSQAKGFTYERGDTLAVDNLVGTLGDRTQHFDSVDDLEAPLLAFLDRLLPGDEHQRHGAEVGVSGRGNQVGGTGSESRKAHARLAGEAAVSGSHETGALLVTCDN